MDKSIGTLYNKLTNLFHSNTSTSSSVSETGSSLPLSALLDRLVPTTNNSSYDPRRNTPQTTRQISIKTNHLTKKET
jgi:hypothetical protein